MLTGMVSVCALVGSLQWMGYPTLGPILVFTVSTQSKKEDKDQETIQSSTTPDPGYHMGK